MLKLLVSFTLYFFVFGSSFYIIFFHYFVMSHVTRDSALFNINRLLLWCAKPRGIQTTGNDLNI